MLYGKERPRGIPCDRLGTCHLRRPQKVDLQGSNKVERNTKSIKNHDLLLFKEYSNNNNINKLKTG